VRLRGKGARVGQYLAGGSDEEDDEVEVFAFCPVCAAREFRRR
jgi:hypothetical protein